MNERSLDPDSQRVILATKVAHHVSMSIPWSAMSALMIAPEDLPLVEEKSSVEDIFQTIFRGSRGNHLDQYLTALSVSAREEGLIFAVENPLESKIVDAWNRFASGEDITAEFGPVAVLRGAIASEIAWAANEGRYRAGIHKPHHLNSTFNRDLFEKRLEDMVPNLQQSLASGTFPDWYSGAIEPLSEKKALMIGLQDWQPTQMISKGRKMEKWSEPEVLPAMIHEEEHDLSM